MTPAQLAALVDHHREAALCARTSGLVDLGNALDRIADTYAAIFEPTPEERHAAELLELARTFDRVDEAGRARHLEMPAAPKRLDRLATRTNAVSWSWLEGPVRRVAWLERRGEELALMVSDYGPEMREKANAATWVPFASVR